MASSILTNANLAGANLKNAFLWDATGLGSAVFSQETTYNQWTQFPADFNPVSFKLTFIESPVGDFDGNEMLDMADVELLRRRVLEDYWGGTLWRFDVYSDGAHNQEDLRIWVKDLKHTWFGDANVDGEFDRLDLVSLLQAGQYQDGVFRNSSWATGDWNADGEFDRTDLLLALQDGGYAEGPRAAMAAVPEPGSLAIVLLAILCGGGFSFAGERGVTRRSWGPPAWDHGG